MKFSSGLPITFPFLSTHHKPKGDDDDDSDADDGGDVDDDGGDDGDGDGGFNNKQYPGHQGPRVR